MGYAETGDMILLKRFTEKGDQQAFCEIVRRYAGMVFSVCRRILNDRARAEEVSQETFFRLMTRPQSVSQSLGGWLHRAATRLAVDERRSEASRRRREADVAREVREMAESQAPSGVRWGDISPHIDEALARLPDRSRLLLIRHFLEGKQQQELAREAGVSAATISRRIKLAADELRRELRGRGVDIMPAALITLWAKHAIESAPAALQLELGKMAMLSGAKVVAAKTLYAMGCRAATALQASAQARWAAAVFFLAALVTLAIRVEMTFGILQHMMTPPVVAHDLTPAEMAGASHVAWPRVNIAGPNDLDSSRIVAFQRGGDGAQESMTLFFADHHALVMTPAQAKTLIEKQTGKDPPELEREQP